MGLCVLCASVVKEDLTTESTEHTETAGKSFSQEAAQQGRAQESITFWN